MRTVILFGLLVGLVALNLVANLTVPGGFKLALVPLITTGVIALAAKRRRQP